VARQQWGRPRLRRLKPQAGSAREPRRLQGADRPDRGLCRGSDVIIPGVEEMRGYSVPRSFDAGEYGPRPGASSPRGHGGEQRTRRSWFEGSGTRPGERRSPFSGPASESRFIARRQKAPRHGRLPDHHRNPRADWRRAYDERFFEPWQDPSAGRGRGFFRPPP
jgi:hypothetical protein